MTNRRGEEEEEGGVEKEENEEEEGEREKEYCIGQALKTSHCFSMPYLFRD